MPDRAPGVHPIEAESYAILAEQVDLSSWPPGARDVVARMVHATADESFASSARIGTLAVDAVCAALRRGATVICDSRMVAAGIGSITSSEVTCILDWAPTGEGRTSTRSATGVEVAASHHPDSAIWVIGTAPTALARLVELAVDGLVRPSAVVGLPVGYVGASEAKDALWSSALRPVSITNSGRRGGSPVAAAAINALARLSRDRTG